MPEERKGEENPEAAAEKEVKGMEKGNVGNKEAEEKGESIEEGSEKNEKAVKDEKGKGTREKEEQELAKKGEKRGKNKDIRYIVRIAAKDLDGNLPIHRALTKIKGIGTRMARNIAIAFEQEEGIAFDSKLGLLPEQLDEKLEGIVLNPEKHGIPNWNLNRRRDLETGENRHLVMADLDFGLRKDLQRLNLIKSYRGLRHSWGLTVRGQRTKSTHRGKGGAIGVMKKDARIAMAGGGKKTEKKEKK